jgi:tetratricopeptide (TPR) repeat protein
VRRLVEAEVLSSAQGLAIAPLADDLQVAADADVVRLTRPRGLDLSGDVRRTAPVGPVSIDLPRPAAMPAFVDFDAWSKTGDGGFMARYDQLQTLAAEEAGKGKGAGVGQRLAFARFLLGSELSFEALGVLGVAAKASPAITADAQFRGLRAVARAMAGRFKEAQADFSAPVLAADPASAVWRGYVAEKIGDHAGARQQFLLGWSVMRTFAPKWRARFLAMDAQAALGVGDQAGARAAMQAAQGLPAGPEDALRLKLVSARLAEGQGQADQALRLYDEVGAAAYGAVAAPAVLEATELRLRIGRLTPKDAEPILNSLRYRWRGDATELETVRSLSKLYVQEGRYREALQALRSANGRLPDLPASIGISQDLADIFRTLFLDGQADGLQPVQALALFFDFKDLTPIGADGDLMVRKLARRLVDVDLLDQAAELLKYQVENRLDGVPKAEVATDLALIQLMNKRPEEALDALNSTRSTLLPNALNAQRRLLEARAHLALGRYDAALELLEGDRSADAEDVRAEIAWAQHDWPAAGAKLEAALGDRWKGQGPLTGRDQALLVRAGTAYSLAGDNKALARLRQRWGRLGATGSAPNAVKVALEGLDGGALGPGDFNRLSSEAATFETWITVMKRRFAAEPTPISGPASPEPTAKGAPASKRRA